MQMITNIALDQRISKAAEVTGDNPSDKRSRARRDLSRLHNVKFLERSDNVQEPQRCEAQCTENTYHNVQGSRQQHLSNTKKDSPPVEG
jgi:hypothetical protein